MSDDLDPLQMVRRLSGCDHALARRYDPAIGAYRLVHDGEERRRVPEYGLGYDAAAWAALLRFVLERHPEWDGVPRAVPSRARATEGP